MGKIAAGVAHAELKYLSFMVALIPGLASSWIASRTANSLPRIYAVLLLSSFSAMVISSLLFPFFSRYALIMAALPLVIL